MKKALKDLLDYLKSNKRISLTNRKCLSIGNDFEVNYSLKYNNANLLISFIYFADQGKSDEANTFILEAANSRRCPVSSEIPEDKLYYLLLKDAELIRDSAIVN